MKRDNTSHRPQLPWSPAFCWPLTCPSPSTPSSTVFVGAVVAIVVVKQMFGGIGQNFVNPALTARIVLMVSFPTSDEHTGCKPFDYRQSTADAITTASPLACSRSAAGEAVPSYLDLFLGCSAGCLGETCAMRPAAGRRLPGGPPGHHRRLSPVLYLARCASVLLDLWAEDPVFQIAFRRPACWAPFFMATDYTTSPL